MGLFEKTNLFRNITDRLTVKGEIIKEHKDMIVLLKIFITLVFIVLWFVSLIPEPKNFKDFTIGFIVMTSALWYFFR